VERILLIEDEPRIASYVARALMAEGYGVDQASNGAEGLALAQRNDYHVVVLDLVLPGKDGVLVLKDIMAFRPAQPVLVLSAVTDTDAKVRCLSLGAFDYVPKPFDLSELMARIRNGGRLRQPASQSERMLQSGTATLDLRRRTLDLGGGPIPLSSREYVLLEYFMRREGDVCTRQELLAEVWGYGFDPGTNVVDVYVRRLRVKGGRKLIETVRDVGYSFVAPA